MLVGESLMRAPDPSVFIGELLGAKPAEVCPCYADLGVASFFVFPR